MWLRNNPEVTPIPVLNSVHKSMCPDLPETAYSYSVFALLYCVLRRFIHSKKLGYIKVDFSLPPDPSSPVPEVWNENLDSMHFPNINYPSRGHFCHFFGCSHTE
ncbi:hypothetical protein PTI98_006805 [Pleurotus ostreatus]|nr:hypothetical protein PTI98_006805 [Pleurotus ostreatus]